MIAAALSEARRSRDQGRLKAAIEALDKAIPLCAPDGTNAARALADESLKLGATLLEKGSVLAALSEFGRALDLQSDNAAARDALLRCVHAYDRWAPPMCSV